MSYPVAYRGGAVARGFQTGPQVAFLDTKLQFQREQMLLPPPPPPSLTYELPWRAWAAALAVWLTRLGEGLVEAPELEEENNSRTWSEEWWEEMYRSRPEEQVSKGGESNPVTVPAYFGWTLLQNCEPCPNQPLYDGHPSGPVRNAAQTCCTGTNGPLVGMFATDNNFRIFNEKIPWLSGFKYSYRKSYTRNAGTVGMPNTKPIIVTQVPTPGYAEAFPDSEWREVPYYDDAWSLPINQPGEVRPPFRVVWPYWFAQPRRPVLPPAVRPRPIWTEPLVADPFEWAPARDPLERPRPQVDPLVEYPTGDPLVDPVIDPVVAPDPWFPPTPDPWVDPFTGDPVVDPEPKAETATGGASSTASRFPGPPEAGTSELKGKGRKFIGIFKAIINIVTEFGDFVDALWKALPKEFRHKCKHKNGKRRKCNTHDKIMDIGDALRAGAMDWETGYWKEALIQLLTNEVVDQFYGRVGQLYAKASAKAFPDGGGRGWQTGNFLKPRVHVKGADGPSDIVERYVRAAVEKAAHALD